MKRSGPSELAAPTLPVVLRGLPAERMHYRNVMGTTILLSASAVWLCTSALYVWVINVLAKLALTTLANPTTRYCSATVGRSCPPDTNVASRGPTINHKSHLTR